MMSNSGTIWQEAEEKLREEISREDFETWFDCVKMVSVDDRTVTIQVPSVYRMNVIRETYGNEVRQVFGELCGSEVAVEYQVVGQPKPDDKSRVVELHDDGDAVNEISCPLSSRYTFDNFVVGESNRLTCAAALSVAKSPAKTYNPLFVYGGVGLGKTHVMQAIGNHIVAHQPGTRVVYCSAEDFVNEFIAAIQRNNRMSFQKKFRNVDVLLIDDIHFLVGKESTQEEFFHTFNALHNRHKQIVISSDRSPKDIPTIEDRLRSRFAWGLITDIQQPDVETRAAILGKKCRQEQLQIPEEVILFIAQRIKTSVRDLEGALIKVAAHAKFTDTKPTVETAAKVLGKLSLLDEREVTIERIQKKVSEHFRIKMSDLLGNDRSRSMAVPRQIAMYLCRTLTRHSYPEIGAYFGGKNHTTVIHSYKKIDQEVETDEQYRKLIDQLKMAIIQPD